jgi:hypothetical protein
MECMLTTRSDQVFDKARIVNCALMAKIHTVEWTPAILAHPALQIAMSANWWGIVGETLTKVVGRISKTSEAISGIPGSGVDHQGIPYSLTEEFVSVYRMHSLIPGKCRCCITSIHQIDKDQTILPCLALSVAGTSTQFPLKM